MENHTEFIWSSTLSLKVLYISLMSLSKAATTKAIWSVLNTLTLLPGPFKHLCIFRLLTANENIHSPFACFRILCSAQVRKFSTPFFLQLLPEEWKICLWPSLALWRKNFANKAPPCQLTLTFMATTFIRITEHGFCGLFLGLHEIGEMGSEA